MATIEAMHATAVRHLMTQMTLMASIGIASMRSVQVNPPAHVILFPAVEPGDEKTREHDDEDANGRDPEKGARHVILQYGRPRIVTVGEIEIGEKESSTRRCRCRRHRCHHR